MKKFIWPLIILIVLGVGLGFVSQKTNLLHLVTINTGIQEETQIANPASVNCTQKGGTSEIITNTEGSQSGLCHLLDGTTCDEWAYYRGECPSPVAQEIGITANQDQISKYENTESICPLENGFYKDTGKQIKFYYGGDMQSQNVYKKNGFLYFLGSIPADEGTKGIHLYRYNCQDGRTNDLHDFGGKLYAMATLSLIDENKLHIYEYYGDSCDSLFGNSSIYDVTNDTLKKFNFEELQGFQKKSGCFCTKNIDIKSGNEAYASCYCGTDGCPEGDPSYKIKFDIVNNKIIENK